MPGFSGQIAGAPVEPSVEDKARASSGSSDYNCLGTPMHPVASGTRRQSGMCQLEVQTALPVAQHSRCEDRISLYTAFVLGHGGYAAGPASMGPVLILGLVLLNYEGLSLGWMTRIAPPNARGGENT